MHEPGLQFPAYPDRLPLDIPKMKMATLGTLTFEAVSLEKFHCLHLAMQAAHRGGGAPAVLNGGNEVVVATYLAGKIHFLDIARALEALMNRYQVITQNDQIAPSFLDQIHTIEDALNADQWGRDQAQLFLEETFL